MLSVGPRVPESGPHALTTGGLPTEPPQSHFLTFLQSDTPDCRMVSSTLRWVFVPPSDPHRCTQKFVSWVILDCIRLAILTIPDVEDGWDVCSFGVLQNAKATGSSGGKTANGGQGGDSKVRGRYETNSGVWESRIQGKRLGGHYQPVRIVRREVTSRDKASRGYNAWGRLLACLAFRQEAPGFDPGTK